MTNGTGINPLASGEGQGWGEAPGDKVLSLPPRLSPPLPLPAGEGIILLFSQASLPDPGSAILRCCSASTPAGVTLAIADCSLFFQPLTTSPSPFCIAS